MKLTHTLLSSLLFLSCIAVQASDLKSASLDADHVDQVLRSPKAVKPVPVDGFYMVETTEGVWLVSDDRRMVITDFKAVDLMSGKPIQTLSDLTYMTKIKWDKLGVDVDKMSVMNYGTGGKIVTVFIDPRCPHCHRLMAQMPKLTADYTFKLVLLPILGPGSVTDAENIWCQKDRAKATEAMVMSDIKALSVMTRPDDCDTSAFRESEKAAKALGLHGVPFIVTPSMVMHPGGSNDLETLLRDDATVKAE
jgi:thiol:disulfide interchange protein DsbC